MNLRKSPTITGCCRRSCCPLTNTLDLIGDKWTLLLIRDMMFQGKRSFNEFLGSLEGIATNILAQRLKRLEKYGIISKKPYTKSPLRFQYQLTKPGEELKPLMQEMMRWGNAYIEGTKS